MKKAKELILAFLLHVGLTLLGLLMTSHTKRYVLLYSLQLHMIREGIIREETASKLNAAMDLVKYEEALEFAALLQDTIWGQLSLRSVIPDTEIVDLTQTCLPYGEARRIATYVVEKTPPWLKYGKDNVDMLQDAMRLLYCQPELHAAQAV